MPFSSLCWVCHRRQGAAERRAGGRGGPCPSRPGGGQRGEITERGRRAGQGKGQTHAPRPPRSPPRGRGTPWCRGGHPGVSPPWPRGPHRHPAAAGRVSKAQGAWGKQRSHLAHPQPFKSHRKHTPAPSGLESLRGGEKFVLFPAALEDPVPVTKVG